MLDTVVSAVIDTLRGAGLNARGTYSGQELNPDEAVICVGVQSGGIVSSGLSEYLGQRNDPERGITELYGYRMELVLSLDIYAPETGGARGCGLCFSDMADALRALPSGIKRGELRCSAAAPDEETGMFKCPVQLGCTAYFLCEAEEETGDFLDFVLKGVLKDVNK